jgi:prepilin-type N-terminal cleavage/methylation domain-containing protein
MLSRINLRSDQGFTLVELLLVIVILAILMLIAVPSYLGHRITAHDTVARTDAKSMIRFIELCATANGGYVRVVKDVEEALCADQPTLEAFNTGPTSLPYGWARGQVEVDPCSEAQDDAGAEWPGVECKMGTQGFFVIAKSRSGTVFFIRKTVPQDELPVYHCTNAGVGRCNDDGTW